MKTENSILFPEEQEDLVMEIRNGNKEAIHELVDSYETMLLEMIEELKRTIYSQTTRRKY